ncbi:hypothetical protein Anas_09966 [Armadillidium nasatum]|uniref:Uncharacterized protein n=1 Tax=Armadillidium nasatum TaxID=96803 RepID=A0A5N5SSX4_9CRUS|nr:hypothetical protein Anas_09966 [Armadillidium nasatum]
MIHLGCHVIYKHVNRVRIHFFLEEGLKDESLSGKAECLRRGILLQLEGLRTVYPYLHFSSSTDPNANIRNSQTPLSSYINVDAQNAVNSSLMSTSSSSSINYSSTGCSNGSSSTGYSGDGMVTNSSDITTTTMQSRRSSNSNTDSPNTTDFFDERDEESYAEGVDPISFRSAVGNCNYHGVLNKRYKSILPGVLTSKPFRCVLVGSLLYFYNKEADNKQKKVINLSCYQLEEGPIDENKFPTRRKEFSFHLSSTNNKKSHTFFTTKKANMDRWVQSIRIAISSASHSSLLNKNDNSDSQMKKISTGSFIIPQKSSSENEYDEEEDEEFYEELNAEEIAKLTVGEEPTNLWKPPTVPQPPQALQPSTATEISDYYSVPEEASTLSTSQIGKHVYYNQQRRAPPERPPLPNILRDNVQQNRPLPQAPEDSDIQNKVFDSKFDDEIYCEIDEDMKKECNFGESMEDSSSLSKEIFDTINRRVPSTPEKYLNGRQNEASSFRNFVSKFTGKNSTGNDSIQGPSWNLNLNPIKKAPSLPPKGTPSFAISDEESEYKVPSSTLYPDSIYNVPSNIPVPVSQEEQHSGRYEDSSIVKEIKKELHVDENSLGICDDSNPKNEMETLDSNPKNEMETLDSNPKNEMETLEIKSSDTQTENQLKEENSKTTLKSKFQCVNESKPKTDEEVKTNSFNSVKDMIAKLNQTDDSLETSQKSLGYSSFRKGKNSPNKIVECKNKIEVSRSVKSIKDNIERGKLKLNISEEDDSDFEVNTNSNECTETYNNLKSTDDTENTREIGNSVSTEDSTVYVAKFAYVSTTEGELSFNRGDEIIVKDTSSEERLWRVLIKGREGFVPKEYLWKKE